MRRDLPLGKHSHNTCLPVFSSPPLLLCCLLRQLLTHTPATQHKPGNTCVSKHTGARANCLLPRIISPAPGCSARVSCEEAAAAAEQARRASFHERDMRRGIISHPLSLLMLCVSSVLTSDRAREEQAASLSHLQLTSAARDESKRPTDIARRSRAGETTATDQSQGYSSPSRPPVLEQRMSVRRATA